MSKNIGIITEQGFVAGSGLGFQEVKKSDLEKDKKDQKKEPKENKNKK